MNEKTLNDMKREALRKRCPSVPEFALPKAKKLKKNATSLQNAIQDYVRLNGDFCEQVATKGTYREGVGYTAGNYTKGSADVHIMMWDTSNNLVVWKCEVKAGRDTIKPDQERYRDMIDRFARKGKGKIIYSIVKTFDDFIEQYNTFKS